MRPGIVWCTDDVKAGSPSADRGRAAWQAACNRYCPLDAPDLRASTGGKTAKNSPPRRGRDLEHGNLIDTSLFSHAGNGQFCPFFSHKNTQDGFKIDTIKLNKIPERPFYIGKCFKIIQMFFINICDRNYFRLIRKNEESYSHASITNNLLFPSLDLLFPNSFSFVPTITVGSNPAAVKTKPIIAVVVLFPCAPGNGNCIKFFCKLSKSFRIT